MALEQRRDLGAETHRPVGRTAAKEDNGENAR